MKAQNKQNTSKYFYNNLIVVLLILFFASVNIFAKQEVEVKGNITELGSDYLVVQNLKFFVDENTEFRDDDNAGFSFTTQEE